jgi:hypothetical protein
MFKRHIILFISGLLFSVFLLAQYPPPAGHPGTTALDKDSSIIIGWASYCKIERGYINISDTTIYYNGSNKTIYGSYLYATGPADDLVVSLGDGGSALLGFEIPVVNRTGPDFAVFENSFSNGFLELAFVEVSSDGQHFVRFPAVSLTPDNIQISTFDTIDATKIHNLAGKYRHAFGTPFDLEDLKDSLGIDLNNIIRIRIIDAIGCILDPFASRDSQGHRVNDPWPTPFDTGGFDLDAIGVIHNKAQGSGEVGHQEVVRIYPNPVTDIVTISSNVFTEGFLKITDPSGVVLIESVLSGKADFDLSSFAAGIYIATVTRMNGKPMVYKIIKY